MIYIFEYKIHVLEYSVPILIQLLKYHGDKTDQTKLYKQIDPNQDSLYNILMHDGIISIQGNDDNDAKILGVIIRCLIDGETGWLSKYIKYRTTLPQLYNDIITNNIVNESDKQLKFTYYTRYKDYIDVIKLSIYRQSYVFDRKLIIRMLNKRNIKWIMAKSDAERIIMLWHHYFV